MQQERVAIEDLSSLLGEKLDIKNWLQKI